jgi:hypothetical protein
MEADSILIADSIMVIGLTEFRDALVVKISERVRDMNPLKDAVEVAKAMDLAGIGRHWHFGNQVGQDQLWRIYNLRPVHGCYDCAHITYVTRTADQLHGERGKRYSTNDATE